MKNFIFIMLFILVPCVIFAAGSNEHRISVGGGLSSTSIKNEDNFDFTQTSFALSVIGIDDISYYSDIIIIADTAYTIGTSYTFNDSKTNDAFSLGVNMIVGPGYQFNFDSGCFNLGGGLHMNVLYTDSKSTSASLFDFAIGLGAVADLEVNLSETFYVGLTADVGKGFICFGDYSNYPLYYDLNNADPLNWNIKLGVGWIF